MTTSTRASRLFAHFQTGAVDSRFAKTERRSTMARSSVREELRQRMRDHLAVAELHPPEEAPLDVRNVASVLRVSPTTLYKYGFNRELNAAEQRQRENSLIAGAIIEQQCFKN